MFVITILYINPNIFTSNCEHISIATFLIKDGVFFTFTVCSSKSSFSSSNLFIFYVFGILLLLFLYRLLLLECRRLLFLLLCFVFQLEYRKLLFRCLFLFLWHLLCLIDMLLSLVVCLCYFLVIQVLFGLDLVI